MGYSVMIEPLLSIEQIAPQQPALEGVQLLVLTSAHAVPALTDQAKQYPLYAVGEATAAAAAAAGCRDVHIAKGDVQDLSRLIVKNCRSRDGTVLHLSGDVIRQGLAEVLNAYGFHYRRQMVYRAVATTGFSEKAIDAWQRRMIAAVLLFSPRTAEVLVRLLKSHGLERQVDSTAAICLSDETATPCKGLVWKAILPAARPNRQALLKALVGISTIC